MKKTVSVICPVHNEQANIRPFYDRMLGVFESLDQERYEWELLFTNNCSTDNSLQQILGICDQDDRVRVLTFSRNFGYQCSIFAGLEHAMGDLFMIIDVDCEDPPEMLHQFLKHHEEGYEIVFGIRDKRDEATMMHLTRKLFYRVNRLLSDYEVVLDMAEFFLITKIVRSAITVNKSNYPFLRAEIGYAGFSKKGIPYKRAQRARGKTHYNLWGNVNFAVAGILSSTTVLLRLSAFIGLPLLVLNVVALGLLSVDWALHGVTFYPALAGLLLIDLTFCVYTGIFSALYIARDYKNGLKRPLYFVDPARSRTGTHEEATSPSG
jgi:polyisoprenyl-phosphate glycosyltransferase